MPYISFGEKDRARWGLDEWLEFDPRDITIGDLQELSERFEFDHTDWPSPYFGEIPLEQAGSPDAQRVAPKWQIQATAWMCLRQNNIPVSWDEAGAIQAGWMRWRTGADEVESPGKDDSPGTTSRRSAASTTPSSGTSSRRSRAKK